MIIDRTFNEVIEPTIFPDGTSQVWKLKRWKENDIRLWWYFEEEAELVHMAQAAELLHAPYVVMPYLPYGRQDKDYSNDKTFALNTFLNLCEAVVPKIYTLDQHSQHDTAFVINIQPTPALKHAVMESRPDVIVYPDHGAAKRYSAIFHWQGPFLWGNKIRDQATGKISSMVLSDGDVKDKRTLIIDDICDGGATFEACAEQLVNQGAANVDLYVTHAILSRGENGLHAAGINRIFTTTSLWHNQFEPDAFPIEDYMQAEINRLERTTVNAR